MIFDTDIFIWHQRGDANATRLIDQAPLRFVSVQTYMEVLQGSRDKREQRLNKDLFLRLQFRILPLTEAIGNRAADFIEAYALSAGLRVGDALIAATAIEKDMPLITSNAKHFRQIPGLEIHVLRVS